MAVFGDRHKIKHTCSFNTCHYWNAGKYISAVSVPNNVTQVTESTFYSRDFEQKINVKDKDLSILHVCTLISKTEEKYSQKYPYIQYHISTSP